MPRTGERVDPLQGYRFSVSFGSRGRAAFTECSISGWGVDYDEIHEGGLHHYTHKLLKPVSQGAKVTLKRGITDFNLFFWFMYIMQGQLEGNAEKVDITIYDAQGKPQLIWSFLEVYPVRWEGPSFDAAESAIAVETLELVYNGFVIQYPSNA